MIYVKIAVSTLLGLGWGFLGGEDALLRTLILFVLLDYLTGVMRAILAKKLSSEVGFRGIFQKMLIFIMVGVAHMVDLQLIGSGAMLRSATIFFYAANEGISILENATALGVPVPSKLQSVLAQFQQEEMEVPSSVEK